MNMIELVNKLKNKYPDKKFCLHDGFSGFRYGSPSNPEFISFDTAIMILNEFYEFKKINPIEMMENDLFTLKLNDFQIKKYNFEMLGFNSELDCSYGGKGLG